MTYEDNQILDEQDKEIEEFVLNFPFDLEKMRRLSKKDSFVHFTANDLQKRGMTEVESLKLTYNSSVLENFHMREVYKKA